MQALVAWRPETLELNWLKGELLTPLHVATCQGVTGELASFPEVAA